MNTASLTARGPEDILAYIPHAIGFWPRNSLVCLTARSGRIGATLRVDLPDRRLRGEALLGYARAVLAYLEHDTAADSTFVAMFQDGPVDSARTERAELMALLAWVLGQAGRPLQELWLVGSDGWNGSGCRHSECSLTGDGPCAGAGPHPLDLIRDSRLAAELVYQGSAVDPHPSAFSRRPLQGPRKGPRGTREGVRGPGERDSPTPGPAPDAGPVSCGTPSLLEALEHWEPYLNGSAVWADVADMMGGQSRQILCRTLEVPALRDAVYVSAGSSWQTAYQGGLAAETSVEDADRPMSSTGSGVVPGVVREDGEGKRDPGGHPLVSWLGLFGDVMVAESGSGPDWDRMNRFAAVLQEMVHAAGDRPPAGVLTGLAWVEWCRGRGSHASALLDRALEREPGHRLARLLNRAILSGALSGWASKRHSSWRRTTAGGSLRDEDG